MERNTNNQKDETLYDLLKNEYKCQDNIYTDSTIVSSQNTNRFESVCLTDKLEDLLQNKDEYITLTVEEASVILKQINELLSYLKPIVDSICYK